MSIAINPPATPRSPSAGAWATRDPLAECRAMLHKKAFRLTHALAGHPLFSVEALVGAAQEASKRKHDVHMDAGNVSVTDKWGKIPVPEMPVWEVIKRIETAGAWVIMKHVEADPRYKVVLDEWADFVRDLAGPEAARLLRNPEMLVMITSPNRVTPFHFDAEVNFLVQIQGSKDVWVCDPNDRTITTEEEIERYYAVTTTAGNYKPHAEERATKFVLAPGDAVHIPTHGAHWVKNHNNVSVSLSLNFEFPHWLQADVYRTNYYLRKLGLSPRPPGRSVVADRLKGTVGFGLRHAKRTAGGVYRSAKRLVRR
jgi:hypothetical protein